MSDYEVTLVNDNSKFCHASYALLVPLLTCLSFKCTSSPRLRESEELETHAGNRQEFYVRFKGPDESGFFRNLSWAVEHRADDM